MYVALMVRHHRGGEGGGEVAGSSCRCDWVLVLFLSGLKVWQKLSGDADKLQSR